MLSLRGGVTYEYVDLVLSVKWAKCNLGAKTETDYGSYFMWGSTKANTPDECTWAKAPFNNGASDFDSDYFNSVKNTVCPNNVLAKEYDTATQIMGGNWRMPTKDELKELIDNTNSVWVEDYKGSGVNGRQFTSKKEGYQDNSIFIPAAGTYFEGSEYDLNKFVDVWSSSLYTSLTDSALTLHFSSGSIYVADDSGFRNSGHVVRGVCK